MRLQRFLSQAGVSSRRTAENYILDGRVKVNEKVIDTLGYKVTDTDVVKFDNKIVKIIDNKFYILLNKPIEYICSNYDKQKRNLAIDLIPEKYRQGLYGVGRLDYMSEGAIIFTNDGDFANYIMHPSYEILKTYRVFTDKKISENLLKKFKNHFIFNGINYTIKAYKIISDFEYEIVLNEGKNREIRNLFNSNQIGIKQLQRIKIGGIKLGNLKKGDWRFLTDSELDPIFQNIR